MVRAVCWVLFCAVIGGLTGLADANVAGRGLPTMVISYDPGGAIAPRQTRIRQLRRSGQRVELRGTCHSACTMYLGLQNVCVSPEARLGFHGPQGVLGRLPRDAFDHWSQVLSDRFRPPLRNWFMSTARHTGPGLLTLRGRDLIAMGYARC